MFLIQRIWWCSIWNTPWNIIIRSRNNEILSSMNTDRAWTSNSIELYCSSSTERVHCHYCLAVVTFVGVALRRCCTVSFPALRSWRCRSDAIRLAAYASSNRGFHRLKQLNCSASSYPQTIFQKLYVTTSLYIIWKSIIRASCIPSSWDTDCNYVFLGYFVKF